MMLLRLNTLRTFRILLKNSWMTISAMPMEQPARMLYRNVLLMPDVTFRKMLLMNVATLPRIEYKVPTMHSSHVNLNQFFNALFAASPNGNMRTMNANTSMRSMSRSMSLLTINATARRLRMVPLTSAPTHVPIAPLVSTSLLP